MPHPPRDSGYSLIEVLTAIALMGVLMAIAVGAWSSWTKASAQSGAAREIQSAMRQAQQRAVTEGKATCVLFNDAADTYAVYSGSCSDTGKTLVDGPRTVAKNVHIDSPHFTLSSGSSAGATFQARGTGSPGDVKVTRDGSSTAYTLDVDWLTGRVSLA
jgi:prepilin-type N-terminal cleavage/methylation domain-containing protein